ncbi:MAG: hypothetical protein KZQ72_15425 [Candidatus Thiodiazotropha sp. (ex Cardiolucina cf. quadrata)]|nr:hypothetical protein [Candidatus Thiodiazotropha sp. (ex Cardiolucina cf. quadrata)]
MSDTILLNERINIAAPFLAIPIRDISLSTNTKPELYDRFPFIRSDIWTMSHAITRRDG